MKKYKIYTEKELEMYHFFEVQKGNLRALREQIDTLRNVVQSLSESLYTISDNANSQSRYNDYDILDRNGQDSFWKANEEFKIARKEEIDSYKQKVLDSDYARFDIDATMEKVEGYPIKGTEHTINYKEESK
tara:strand:+ start:47 stop:442 length:396 start_codon:yes stop_codon:yes gene_type:complete